MMKVKSDSELFVLPSSGGIHLIAKNDNSNLVIEYLNSYFGQKKKTKCIVLDDEDDPIDMKSVNFIHIPASIDIESIFNFKAKTEINNELSQIIEQNSELFISIENIRKCLQELLTDAGIYSFKKIMTKDIGVNLEIDIMNFEIQKLLQLLRINTEELTKTQQLMMLYNLLIYVNRHQFSIIYIDFDFDESVYKWVQSKKNDNCLFLINNESIHPPVIPIFDSIIILNNSSVIEKEIINSNNTGTISYLLHPIVRENIDMQTEKNIRLLKEFEYQTSTFFLEFTDSKRS